MAESDRQFFSLDEANHALPYVSRVTQDIQTAYRHAVALQEKLESLAGEEDELDRLTDAYEDAVDRLNRCVDELHLTGAELKDYDLGLVDFPAHHDGREICLCWKIGEARIGAWHEADSGYSGRRDVALLQAAPVAE